MCFGVIPISSDSDALYDFVVPGLHPTERKCQKDKQDEEMDRNTAFEYVFCFDV